MHSVYQAPVLFQKESKALCLLRLLVANNKKDIGTSLSKKGKLKESGLPYGTEGLKCIVTFAIQWKQ